MMAQSTPQSQSTTRIQHYILTLAVVWTGIVVASAAWALYSSHQSALNAALIEAQASFNKDLVYRRWAAIQGGVYVPITDHTPPNPYLVVPDREVTLTDGRVLTLVNPAYMTRQVHELAQDQYGARGHITSLNPIRPENAPDDWEADALRAFEQGVTQVSAVESIDGQPNMRFMQALITEQSCLKCHANQGYKVGDIRGGISVSVPIQPYWDAARPIQQGIILGHGILWSLGIAGILLSGNRYLIHVRREEAITESLRESEQRFRHLAANVNDIIYRLRLKPDLRFEYVSPAAEAITGYTPEEFCASPQFINKLINPEDLQQIQADLQQSSYKPIMLRWVRKDGTIIWMEQKHTPITDTSGTVIALEGIARDITERKQAQQHEFELALEKERRHLLTDFIQNATHEFRTPLSTITTSTYLLSYADNPEKRHRKADQVEHQVQRITRLVDMLLLMVELESGDTLTRSPVSLDALIAAICSEAVTEYSEKPVLRCEKPEHLPQVMGDADYLTAAVKQLLDNAYRFTSAEGTITIAAGASDQQVWLEIRDTGSGISADALPHIFKTFWRQDTAHSTPGFGLGLPIAQKIIEQHGGEITVTSEINRGTCFRITLPAASSDTLAQSRSNGRLIQSDDAR
jgi:PAS domain S-box-containing protein